MTKTFEPIPSSQLTINDFQYGYAQNSRNIVPELKFHYSHLKYIPLIQFSNTGKTFDTVFHKFEYQMREIVDYKWDNNIRKIYYYDGAKIALPFHCLFVDPANQDFFEISIWNLDGSKIIYNKLIQFKQSNFEWHNFILPEDIVQEIGKTLRTYYDELNKHII